MSFFLRGNSEGEASSYAEDSRTDLHVRENLIYDHACRQTHAGHSTAEARVAALEQSIYGDSSDASPDVQQLLERLRQEEEELEKLRLLDSQHAQVGRTVGSDLWWFSIMCLG
jgi:hypothetical protein